MEVFFCNWVKYQVTNNPILPGCCSFRVYIIATASIYLNDPPDPGMSGANSKVHRCTGLLGRWVVSNNPLKLSVGRNDYYCHLKTSRSPTISEFNIGT